MWINRFFNRLKASLRLGDDSGSMTVEFVLYVPLLGAWFIGSFVYFDAYRSQSQTAKVAYTVSDILSRSIVVDDTWLQEVFDLQDRMMPVRIRQSWVRISSICYFDDDETDTTPGTHTVMWSYVNDPYDTEPDPLLRRTVELTDATVPGQLMPLMASGDSIVLTEVSARWTPLVGQFAGYVGLQPLNWRNALVERPRFTTLVPKTDATDVYGPSEVCPTF